MKSFAEEKSILYRTISALKRPFIKFDTNISILFYGNSAGLLNNIIGDLLTTKKVDPYKTKGFKKLKDCPKNLLEKIQKKYYFYLTDDYYSSDRSFIVNDNNEKISFTRHIEGDALFKDEIRQILKFYRKEIDKVIANEPKTNLTLYRNYNIPEKYRFSEIFSEYWHNDRRATNYWKLFINLSLVDNNSGPLNFLPLDKTKNFNRISKKRRNNSINDQYDSFVHKLVGPPGSAILINTEKCLHRATIPNETRDILHLLIW